MTKQKIAYKIITRQRATIGRTVQHRTTSKNDRQHGFVASGG